VTERNAGALAALCARLEGLPLAIELAAAWAQTLTPAQMMAELKEGFPLLVSRNCDATARHRSLHAAIEWSCRLLDPSLRAFFARLAVFRGGWETAAAQIVCREPDALSRIAALRDRSLVVADPCGERMRYRMLEPVRDYARELLTESERIELARRHAAYYLSLAEEAEKHLRAAAQKFWAERLRADHANLQAALEESETREEGLHMAAALSYYWQLRGDLREGSEWLDRALSNNPEAPPDLRARALFGAAALAYLHGDEARGEALCAESLRLCDLLSDPQAFLEAIRPLTSPNLLLPHSSLHKREPRLLEALGRGEPDRRVQALRLGCEGRRAQWCGEYAEAAALYERSLTIYRELGDRQGIATLLHLRGSMAEYQGDDAATRRYWEESLETFRELDDQIGIGDTVGALGYAAYRRGDFCTALRAEGLEALAELRARQQQDAEAVGLYAEADDLREATGAPMPLCERPCYRRELASLRARLGPERFAAVWEGAHRMAREKFPS